MESIASRFVKHFLCVIKYKQPYLTSKIDPKAIRKDDVARPTRWMCWGCIVTHENSGANTIWYITPKNLSSNKILVYFHGGAFIGGMVKQQWNTIAKIARLSDSRVIIPDYPLAPENNYKDAINMVSKNYAGILKTSLASDIAFIGDSAGGGLMLSFAMLLRNNGIQLPTKLIALSPWVDASMSNPTAATLEPLDPMIAVAGLKKAGEWWADGEDTTHYLISPLYGKMDGLPPIHIFAGTHDILQPDEKLFAEKAKASEIDTYYYEYPAMIHGWMFLPIPEAKDAIKKIVEIC